MTEKLTENMDRLWKNTDRSTGCWIWLGLKSQKGYGSISYQGKGVRTHRLAWQLTNGQIPPGMMVCHSCDNPSCINPDHLFLGTNSDNQKDRVSKGRKNRGEFKKGESHWCSKLTRAQVDEMRRIRQTTGLSESKLAKMFGIGKSQSHNILIGNGWK
jgi:hypothetical protein